MATQEDRLTTLEQDIKRIEEATKHIDHTLYRLELKLAETDTRFDKVDALLGHYVGLLREIRDKLDERT